MSLESCISLTPRRPSVAHLEVPAMRTVLLSVLVVLASLALLAGCSTAPKSEEGKADLDTQVDRALAKAKVQDPSLQAFLEKSYGYAVFPSVGKGGAIVGGA